MPLTEYTSINWNSLYTEIADAEYNLILLKNNFIPQQNTQVISHLTDKLDKQLQTLSQKIPEIFAY